MAGHLTKKCKFYVSMHTATKCNKASTTKHTRTVADNAPNVTTQMVS